MKRIRFFTVFLAALILGLFAWKILQMNAPVNVEKTTTPESSRNRQAVENQIVQNGQKKISFENVAFTYDADLFSDVIGEIVPASPLEDETSRPDDAYPEHINFIFQNPYTGERTSGNGYYLSPRIHVYPVEEFKQVYLFHGIDLKAEFTKLKRILEKTDKISVGSSSKQLPYLPFADASQMFHARAGVINFHGGKGFGFLTQFNQDPIPINNRRLEYIFQGLTNDNKYLVFMEFPVSAEGLPDNDDVGFPEKHDKLNESDAYLQKDYAKLYDRYALDTARGLNKMPSEKFAPNLDKIKSLIASLEIK